MQHSQSHEFPNLRDNAYRVRSQVDDLLCHSSSGSFHDNDFRLVGIIHFPESQAGRILAVTVEDVIAATNIITVITIVKNFFISFLLIIIYI